MTRLDTRWFWSRSYRLPAAPFTVTTDDGIRLHGHRVGTGSVAVILVHGFMGWHRKARLVDLQEGLANSFTVYGFDLRGHGRSEGVSGYGSKEHRDIEAVVRLARAEGAATVITLGGSMGGIAAIGHAALIGGADGVVAVSTPARWDGHHSDAVRRMAWLTGTPTGRRVLEAFGVRVPSAWEPGEEPAELVGRIAPAPVLLIHGRDDHFFDEEEAWLLYRRAGTPKRLWLARRFGHAEDGYTLGFARQLAPAIREMAGGGLVRAAT